MSEFLIGVPTWVWLALLVMTAAYYLLTPLSIRSNTIHNGHPQIVVFDPAAVPLPPEVEPQVNYVADGLARVGFERYSGIALPNPVNFVKAVCLLYVNHRESCSALHSLIYIHSPGLPSRLALEYVEIITAFREQSLRSLSTSNSSQLGAFPKRDDSPVIQVPQIQDPERLYDLHCRALEIWGAERRSRFIRLLEEYGGDITRYFQEAVICESYQQQEQTGFLEYDAAIDAWRPTAKGAYLMTWQQMWPWKGLRESLMRAHGRQLEMQLLG